MKKKLYEVNLDNAKDVPLSGMDIFQDCVENGECSSPEYHWMCSFILRNSVSEYGLNAGIDDLVYFRRNKAFGFDAAYWTDEVVEFIKREMDRPCEVLLENPYNVYLWTGDDSCCILYGVSREDFEEGGRLPLRSFCLLKSFDDLQRAIHIRNGDIQTWEEERKKENA